MSINLSTFWTTWGVFSGNTSSTNQYDFWRGLIMSNGDQPIPTPTPTATATATPTPTPTATPTPTPTPPAPPVSTGLVGWYVGSDVELTGGVVSTWPDNSGNNNDLVQAISDSRPSHNTDRVTFNGSDEFMTGSTNMTIGHVFIVMTPSGTEAYGSLFSTIQSHIIIREDANNMYFSFLSIFGEGPTATNMRVNEVASTTLGTTKKQFNTKGTPVSSLRLGVGRDFNGGTYASGDIYEILIYNVSLSDTDRDTVENYLQTKYSL